MAKTYVTFGQDHVHRVNETTFDCDCVAVIECDDETHGRKLAFDFFGPKFCFSYFDDQFDMSSMRHFPRGFIEVN
jgi:hypothetical protein